MRAVRIVAVLLILVHDNQLSWPNILSDGILADQDVEWLRTGQTRGRESARASSRVSHHQHWTGS